MEEDERVHYDTVLTPHRSLGQRGLVIIMAVVSAVSFAAGLTFYLIGAWPVVGFLGLDVLLVYIALRANLRHAQARERLRLTDEAMVIERTSHRGVAHSVSLQPYWLNVQMDEPVEYSQVWLTSHGRRVAVGSFLGPVQRLILAGELRQALAKMREPRY
jgi:uncharacterized membrane protein